MDLSGLADQLRKPGSPGFRLFKGFADSSVYELMLDDVIQIARSASEGKDVAPAVVAPEAKRMAKVNPEDIVSKIFCLHRRPAFLDFFRDERVAEIVMAAIGPNVDCFLSQFIFKNPGAWGQPWHQDAYYFPFTPARPVMGLWLAVTKATLENGCLHVLPGSQREPVHEHIPDRRENSNYGYVEIVDHDMSASEPCLLDPGDLLVFDSHLMHRSTDNVSDDLRAAMVWHFAAAGTEDKGIQDQKGSWRPNPINDWMPYIRDGVMIGL